MSDTIISQSNPLLVRPTYMEVALSALKENLTTIKRYVAPAKVMAVVKANAYGHGLIPASLAFIEGGADYLGVALVEEGILLRQAGIEIPVLVFGGIFGDQIEQYIIHDLDLTASSISKLNAIEATCKKLNRRARVHLKIDTGMERIGVHYYSAETFFTEAANCRHCDIVGVFSHLATAEETDAAFTRTQLERFVKCLSHFDKLKVPIPMRHIANSAATLSLKESHLDMVRVGVAAYGVSPKNGLPRSLTLTPAMSLKSTVVYFKVVKSGASVSYGRTWTAKRDTRVVTIPIGYGDGFFRQLSNRGEVLIRGKQYPIVGTVCMDQMMVDIGNDEAYNGDEVVLIGNQGTQSISIEEVAEKVGTVPHEVLTSTNLRVPRRYL